VQIGIQIPDFTRPEGAATLGPALANLSRLADDSGYSHIAVMDHFFQIRGVGPAENDMLEAYTALGFLAAATSRAKLVTLVTGVHYRAPGLLAKTVTTLDVLSQGRAWLGIGAGWNEEESGAYGMELGNPRERSDRFEEACQVLIGLMSTESTTFNGKYYQLNDARNEPKGPQTPHPPICIGGSGEKRTLRTTAKYAQHWNFVGGTPEEFAHKRDVLYAHCADVGRDPTEITLSAHVRPGPDGEWGPVADHAAALGAEGLDLAIAVLPVPHTPAVLESVASTFAQVR
jgi:F420-dependent oxidoreductase-like protein